MKFQKWFQLELVMKQSMFIKTTTMHLKQTQMEDLDTQDLLNRLLITCYIEWVLQKEETLMLQVESLLEDLLE